MKPVAGYIQRKTMLYQTGVEYGDYTMNHVQGCAHGCLYPCYAYLMKKRFGQIKTYEDWIHPFIVSNTLELLDKELPRLKNKIKSVHLCFSTDPFMHEYDEIAQMSLASIEKINKFGIPCTVLTKGVLPKSLADNKYRSDNEYGITLVSLSEEYRIQYEPFAAPIADRLASLKILHDSGAKTWVSIEPYPTPNIITQSLLDILNAVKFVDKIIFGRTNYCKLVTAYNGHNDFYNQSAQSVMDFCERHQIHCHIKAKTMTP